MKSKPVVVALDVLIVWIVVAIKKEYKKSFIKNFDNFSTSRKIMENVKPVNVVLVDSITVVASLLVCGDLLVVVFCWQFKVE